MREGGRERRWRLGAKRWATRLIIIYAERDRGKISKPWMARLHDPCPAFVSIYNVQLKVGSDTIISDLT